MTGEIQIEQPPVVSDELLEAMASLLPQLSRSAKFSPELIQALVSHDATNLLIARLDGRIVGALTLVMYPLPTGKRAHIDDVVVDESARGRGVGGSLVAAAIAIAEQQGARTVDLTSRPSRTAAIKLYSDLGFKQRDSHVYRYVPSAE